MVARATAPIGCALGPISYENNSTRLESRDQAALDAIASCLATHPEMKIWVLGRADETAGESYDWVQGFERANAAVEYLVQKGVDRGRLFAAAAGPDPAGGDTNLTFEAVEPRRLKRALAPQD